MDDVKYDKSALDSLKCKNVLGGFAVPKMKSNLSPFRYPGGKAKLSPFLAVFISTNGLKGCDLLEPFCGGAGGTLPLLDAGIIDKLILNDSNLYIASFWDSVLNDTQSFIREIRKAKIDMKSWYEYRDIFNDGKDSNKLEKALSVFFLNRTNRSGILHAGPIGGQSQNGSYMMDCRFNKDDLINRIKYIAKFKSRIIVKRQDAKELVYSLKCNDTFIYADPPYVKEGKNIYKKYCFETIQHQNFASVMKEKVNPWLISYDDHPLVHDLYATRGINVVELSYVMNRARVGRELLIASSNLNMPLIQTPPSTLKIAQNIRSIAQ